MDRAHSLLPASVKLLFIGIVFFLAAGSTAACRREVPTRDIPGTYRARHDFGTEELTLNPDGTYEQSFAEPGRNPTAINRGTWTLQKGDVWDPVRIMLTDAIQVADETGRRTAMNPMKGLWQMPVRRSGRGEVQIVVHEDIGVTLDRVR
jgi:hypothetical protein